LNLPDSQNISARSQVAAIQIHVQRRDVIFELAFALRLNNGCPIALDSDLIMSRFLTDGKKYRSVQTSAVEPNWLLDRLLHPAKALPMAEIDSEILRNLLRGPVIKP
jgi:hypothetical protein